MLLIFAETKTKESLLKVQIQETDIPPQMVQPKKQTKISPDLEEKQIPVQNQFLFDTN